MNGACGQAVRLLLVGLRPQREERRFKLPSQLVCADQTRMRIRKNSLPAHRTQAQLIHLSLV